jgi:hypothetical protein
MCVAESKAVMVVSQGEVHIEHVFGAGHGHVKQATLLVHAGIVADGHVGRHHAIGRMDDVDHVPLAALCRVDRAENQIVFFKKWRLGKVGSGSRRIEGEISDEPGA